MKQSDIVLVNSLLSEETFYLISEKELGLMKRTDLILIRRPYLEGCD
jgi:lactate dehydrogenase-like 2-hydroxyacid dehydrogenase